jgi:hypothetical protein
MCTHPLSHYNRIISSSPLSTISVELAACYLLSQSRHLPQADCDAAVIVEEAVHDTTLPRVPAERGLGNIDAFDKHHFAIGSRHAWKKALVDPDRVAADLVLTGAWPCFAADD